MTREEAADLLDNLIGMVEDNQENDYDEALKMAIEALNVTDTNVGDTISRQSAIDAIEAYFGDLPIMGHYDMLQLIKKLPSAQPEQRWIPVTEQLPEKRKYVLVLYKNNDMAVACWGDGDEDSLFWRAMIDEGWCTDCETDPTHWMPLPEPWKGEDDADNSQI